MSGCGQPANDQDDQTWLPNSKPILIDFRWNY